MKFAASVLAFLLCGLTALPLSAQSLNECRTLRHHGQPGPAQACFGRLANGSDPYLRAEGLWGIEAYKEANDQFRDVVKSNPKNALYRVRWGRLFLARFVPTEASGLFGEALEIDKNNADAYLGLALVAAEDYGPKAVEYAQKAAELNPKLYEAHELLAYLALEDTDETLAAKEADKALDISNEALDAMAIHASLDFLHDKKESPWMDRLLKINPVYGEAYSTAAHFFFINRRYDEEIAYFRKALDIEPDLLSARSNLGIALMQVGRSDEAKAELDKVWSAGFQDKSTQNALNLLTIYQNYDTFKTPAMILKIPKKESALVRPYLEDEVSKILATYDKKYKYHLPGPVQVEVYPNHDDFAVRTMGMPGLGILGVTFNRVVALDSPTASDPQRPPGSFHWGETLWHEMSHVYVLSMTHSRVPRWFTEGLAVYEESATHPDWGDGLDHASIQAISLKKLLPVAELDRGYIHPSYPEQVIVSYYQGGRVITYIVEKWGYGTILNMIHDYAENMPTPQVIEKELKIKPEDFDKQFIPWIEAQTKKQVDGFQQWSKGVRDINEKVKAKDWDAVIKEGLEIRDIYPDYVDPGSVYEALAQAYEAKKDTAKAMEELKLYSKNRGRNPGSLVELATMQEAAGDSAGARTTLEKITYIYLRDEKQHQMLADLDMKMNDSADAIREYSALIALKPVDPAGAHYHLAEAYHAAKKDAQAMDEVLSSLESAPGYRDAEKLLLELNAKSSNQK